MDDRIEYVNGSRRPPVTGMGFESLGGDFSNKKYREGDAQAIRGASDIAGF